MANLYLVSVEGEVGKTALALGLALHAREQGYRVGYMKPIGVRMGTATGHLVESDAEFVKGVLGLEAPVEMISPVLLTDVIRREAISDGSLDAAAAIRTALAQLSRDTDLMILEGPPNTRQGVTLGVDAGKVAEITDSKAVVVLRGEYQVSAEAAHLALSVFGKRLIGAVMNATPVELVDEARGQFGPYLEKLGLKLFGVLPQDPMLGAFTVGELTKLVDGRMLYSSGANDVLVETFIVGAMGAEAALRYFMRQANKAVITGGDRTDIILAALDTPTRCIILTGNLMPDQVAITRAVDRKVPLILAPIDTLEAVRRIEESRGPVRLASRQQVDRLHTLIHREFDFESLVKALDL